MMGLNTYNMMGAGGWGVFAFLGMLFWIVLLIDLILLGIWIWKKIQKLP